MPQAKEGNGSESQPLHEEERQDAIVLKIQRHPDSPTKIGHHQPFADYARLDLLRSVLDVFPASVLLVDVEFWGTDERSFLSTISLNHGDGVVK